MDANPDLLSFVATITAAHIMGNRVSAEELPDLIRSVYAALTTTTDNAATVTGPDPAVPVDKSVFPDYIVCLEDGHKLKMLKRHLMVHFQMTPAAYRKKWGLPNHYPMVAPNYGARRSALAKSFGLGLQDGHRPKRKETPPASAPVVQLIAEGKRGKKVRRA